MGLQITLFYTSLFSLFFLYLSTNVVRLRMAYKVGLGDGGHLDLLKAIRIHGNFSEYVPLALILLLLSELVGGRPWMLHVLGILLFVGRIFHMIALKTTQGHSSYRVLGVVLTWTVILVLSLFCLISAL